MLTRNMGFSLIELMIAVTLGSMLLLGVTSVYSSSLGINSRSIQFSQLNEEAQALMTFMVKDLRRTGYWANATTAVSAPSTNPRTFVGTVDNTVVFAGEAANSCITFAYDGDADGALDVGAGNTNENYGFRLRSSAVEMRQGGAACTATGWEALTDADFSTVNALTFTTVSTVVDNVTSIQITITLTMTLVSDTSISRTMIETLTIRNVDYVT